MKNERERNGHGPYPMKIPYASVLKKMSTEEIMVEYDVCSATAKMWLKKRGISFANSWDPIRQENMKLKWMIKGLKKWVTYAPAFMVLTDAQVQKAFGINRFAVDAIRKKFGWVNINRMTSASSREAFMRVIEKGLK